MAFLMGYTKATGSIRKNNVTKLKKHSSQLKQQTMSMTKTLGGDRLGSGKKMKVELHGYERSTHNLGYLWRSTMSAGTLVPFLCEVALPGDTFDINLDADIKTHPTVGPLFGSYKVQLDVFQTPIRLYQGKLHNNKLGIGLDMKNIFLPLFNLKALVTQAIEDRDDPDNSQINPSCLLSYLGIRGVGRPDPLTTGDTFNLRTFNAIPLLAYWDIYKNYYANKQEENGYVIHTPIETLVQTIDSISIDTETVDDNPGGSVVVVTANEQVIILYTGASPNLNQVILLTSQGSIVLADLLDNINDNLTGTISAQWRYSVTGIINVYQWRYIDEGDLPISAPIPTAFPLKEIDDMREYILVDTLNAAALDIGALGLKPYQLLLDSIGSNTVYKFTQEGLGLKTYQSDLFNNWLNEESITGAGGINEITSIDTSSGSFNLDTLALSKKVYYMLNRIAVSGGTYDDWLDAVWTHERYKRIETPQYMGGLIRELVFQEVISNSESQTEGNSQPLGTLAGKGIMAGKRKGGSITIKTDEPSYIMAIISITPRIDYSQGNKWDIHLKTMDDLHKPALDEIGFQDLITEQMAWWDTAYDHNTELWVQKSAGKQPAWLNYMTNVNQTRGNFAVLNNEMFMTLNRRYEYEKDAGIKDLTTYIDPVKCNYSFAQTAIDAQNFWAQISLDITARRKMSAKIMPNL